MCVKQLLKVALICMHCHDCRSQPARKPWLLSQTRHLVGDLQEPCNTHTDTDARVTPMDCTEGTKCVLHDLYARTHDCKQQLSAITMTQDVSTA